MKYVNPHSLIHSLHLFISRFSKLYTCICGVACGGGRVPPLPAKNLLEMGKRGKKDGKRGGNLEKREKNREKKVKTGKVLSHFRS